MGNVTVEVIVKDKNKIVAKVRKESDLILLNFANYLVAILVGTQELSSKTFSGFIDENGDSFEIIVGYNTNRFEYTQYFEGYLAIGEQSGTPTRNDYTMFDPNHIKFYVETEQVIEEDGRATLVLSGSVTLDRDFTIREVGLFIQLKDSTGTIRRMLLLHDVLDTPLTVKARQTITISYKFKF